MSNVSKKMLMAAAGAAGGGAVAIEDVFSTTLYNGNSSNQTITNGIDLAGEGGSVWLKTRNNAGGGESVLIDTARGATKRLRSHSSDSQATETSGLTAFTSTGFSLGNDSGYNYNTGTYVSWTFRKSPKFFDVVTFTGNGTSGRTVSHNLGSVPGMIWVKGIDVADHWHVYHTGVTTAEDKYLVLNDTGAATDSVTIWNDTAPTDTVFTLGNNGGVNGNGSSYVAYLFADNASEDAENRLISCGSYAGNESTYPTITLGFEPQFLLIKCVSHTGNWLIFDTMRSLVVGGGDEYLRADTTGAETTNDNQFFNISATGFSPSSVESTTNGNGKTFVYVAIRRPNMATITDATKVYTTVSYSGNNTDRIIGSSSQNPTDMVITQPLNIGFDNTINARLTGNTKYQTVSGAAAEATFSNGVKYDQQYGQKIIGNELTLNRTSYTYQAHHFSRAKGFFELITYTGNDSVRTLAHGLGVVPEMIWVKTRSTANAWWVYYGDNTDYLVLNTTAATVDSNYPWQDTSPTSSVFTVGDISNVNQNNATIIAYLFASLAGVSKIGTVTHSGSSTDVACGFSAGARFVMLKRIDATGDWIIWNSVTGIVSGNDPYKILNDTATQVTNTDFIDPLTGGFQISGDFTDGDYLFYAIA